MADYLITGATGFVGSHLVEALARRGWTARALVRETSDVSFLERHGIRRVTGTLEDPESLRRALGDADTVLHLAAATRALRPEAFHSVNAAGMRNLLTAMEADGRRRRLVYLSSLAAAGPARGRPVRPSDEPRPITTYGRSKLDAERAALGRTGTGTAVLRAPAVYGPRDRDLLTFFRLAKRGILPVLGGGKGRIQMVHAADLAEALLLAAAGTATGTYHVAEPRAYLWSEILERMADAVGRRGVQVRVPAGVVRAAGRGSERLARWRGRPAIFDREKAEELLGEGWLCETDAAREAFGFEAVTPLRDGLRGTAEWYRSQGWL